MEEIRTRWVDMQKVLSSGSSLAPEHYDPTEPLLEQLLTQIRVLVIGAGGLGCELLKDLSLSGFRNIEVIDMDTIDLSNLNRQFLFRPADVGSFKAETAAKFINKRIAGANVIAHCCEIQKFDADFYRKFHLIVCGLDSIIARRWMNSMVHSLLKYDSDGILDQSTIIPMIDGGTEGFQGNIRVVYPGMTACFECGIDLFPPQRAFPLCTIADKPRLPEHCIEYAKLIIWKNEKGDAVLDSDNPEDIKWLFEKASERAAVYGISGVTYQLTQGVVKNIIPAVASTNAVIAAMCTMEALKCATSFSKVLNNFAQFNDGEGIYTNAYEIERKSACLICCNRPIPVPCTPRLTLQQLINIFKESDTFKFVNPGLLTHTATGPCTLYMPNPEHLRTLTEGNLSKTLAELGLSSGDVIHITDKTSANFRMVELAFSD